MGLDLCLLAEPKEEYPRLSSVYFLNARKSGMPDFLFRYFGSRLLYNYDPWDEYKEYPFCRLTISAWNDFINALLERVDLLLYLSDFVLSDFPGEEWIPCEIDLSPDIDYQKLVDFDIFFSKTFKRPPRMQALKENIPDELVEDLICDAYGLNWWLGLDLDIRRYLLDDKYEVLFVTG